jgi:cell wall-associated NlpC family hydrolase
MSADTVPPPLDALAVAEQYLGTPYVWGGATPRIGFDSSGLVQYSYGQVGIQLPRIAQDQFLLGAPVDAAALLRNDLVFFRDPTGYVFHVGIWAGPREFIHAPHTGDVIKFTSLDVPFYALQFAGGRRVAS